MVYVLFFIGFVLLIKGADWLVDSASNLARRYGVSDMVVGLTIVSFGTSLPELTVNMLASFGGSSDIAVGNILGSNIANILLILGASALVCALPVQRPTVLSEIPFSLTAALLVGFLANSGIFQPDHEEGLMIDRIEGLVIIFFFVLFMAYIADMALRDNAMREGPYLAPDKSKPVYFHLLVIGAGVLALFIGGKWVVDGAVRIAGILGMSEALIGLTVIAVGTSLPELVTSVVAAYRGNTDIAVGNVVGSNIFNLLWVLGLSATIRPLPFQVPSNVDILMIIVSSTLLLVALVFSRKWLIARPTGALFLLIYAAYTAYLIWRG